MHGCTISTGAMVSTGIVHLRGGGFQLAENFDPQVITLFKEVRNLLWLDFQVPHAITNMTKDAKRVYPHAMETEELWADVGFGGE